MKIALLVALLGCTIQFGEFYYSTVDTVYFKSTSVTSHYRL